MALQQEIETRAKQIHTDGYDLSIGELMSLYKEKEIDIHPEFQRFFRWTPIQKTKLIESILLGIPIPPIFVSQRGDGVWDVIDGLQRLSTILEFAGILRDAEGELKPASSLLGTEYLPSLEGKFWQNDEELENSFDQSQRLIIKRAKLGVQIIKKESDKDTKFELFQRLNTGGTSLTDQEIRNCILVMINKDFYKWLSKISQNVNFKSTIAVTARAFEEQYDVELALRYFVYKTLTVEDVKTSKDVGKLLTDKMVEFANNTNFNYELESINFEKAFLLLDKSFGEDVFRKWDNDKNKFVGPFSIAAFEVIASGLARNSDKYEDTHESIELLKRKIKSVSKDAKFLDNAGSGKRASTRLPHFLPLGQKIFGNED
jgi:Protein of unknown function DUF262